MGCECCSAGDPNCVHIGSVMAEANQTYTVVVSDQDDFDAVLPARTVKYITVRYPAGPNGLPGRSMSSSKMQLHPSPLSTACLHCETHLC